MIIGKRMPMEDMPDPHRKLKKFCALCGVAGPILYTLAVFSLGAIQPGYNHSTQLMSELGEVGAPHAVVMNLFGFALTGILILVFAWGFFLELRKIQGIVPATSLLALTGILYLAESYFRCDAGCIPPATFSGFLHLLLGEISVAAMVVASFTIAFVLKKEGHWQGYWQYSVLTGAAVLLLMPFMPAMHETAGLFQRVLVGIILLWWELLAIRLYRLASAGGTGS
jgi:hypothetical membrane protein